MKTTGYVVVFVTCATAREAKRIAMAVIRKKLVACATIIPGAESHFRWKGKVEHSREVVMTLKTRESSFEDLAREISRLHSYEVPEIIAMPIVAGSQDYLRWVGDSVRQ